MYRTSRRYKEDYDRQYGDIELIKRFWKYLTAYKLQLVIIIITILTISGISILPPLMVQYAFERLEMSEEWLVIAPYAIAYVGLSIFLWILQVIQNILVTIVTQKIIKRIQMETYKSLQEHDLSFFDKEATGKIMSRLTNDSQELNNMISVVAQFISNFVIVFSVLGVMFYVNWQLALVTLGMGPIVFLVGLLFRRLIRRTSGRWRAAIGEVNAAFQESVAGISVAKAFGREEKSKEEFEEINDETFQQARKRAIAITGIWPVMDGISILGIFGINLFGSWLVFENMASASTIIFFILLLNRFLYPLMRVAAQISTIQSGFAAMERILSIIDADKEITNPEEPVHKNLQGKITFENVYHEYEPNTPVLKDINLKIQPGESIAIVGHTGAGKTTIASLLMRFYDINKGSIKIDGVDVRDYDFYELRSQIGLVSQDVFLFSGTVLDNIRFGKPDASIEEVQNVIAIVAAQEFIEALPDGLETELGERGKGLSAGQRQMISFARTLLTDPKILILDEATAAVDAYTESKIQEALDHLLANRTSIVIAHRLTTIKNSDRIIVLDQGEIAEEGDHESLMNKGGLYSELYETYFKHQSAEWISEISEVFSE
ncbi:MAG: ATP-binding cassette domain-containing protein [Candidatus Heimdallarchaeota archaeon]|nr:ATP-binding cassette domain-containing protein [Candidatus Heimdallarchaeota archaeon]